MVALGRKKMCRKCGTIKDLLNRKKTKDYWKCRSCHRAVAAKWRLANREHARRLSSEWYHKADGGYIRRRKRELTAHRTSLREQLAHLQQLEADLLAEQRHT